MKEQKHGVPCLLSLMVPGLGQIVKGEWSKGATILFSMFGTLLIVMFTTWLTYQSTIGGFTTLLIGWLGILIIIVLYFWQLTDAYNYNPKENKQSSQKDSYEEKNKIPESTKASVTVEPSVLKVEDVERIQKLKKIRVICNATVRYVLVFFFLLIGFILLLTGVPAGILWTLIGLIWIHPIIRKVTQLTNFKFTRTIKIILTIVLFLLALKYT